MAASGFTVLQHVVPATFIRERRRSTIGKSDSLSLAVKQYKWNGDVSDRSTPITVIGAHANAFPKELYEPLWDDLQAALAPHQVHIGNVFVADVATQGASGVLNEERLGDEASWMDHPRDLLLMINMLRSHMDALIVGIAHSMGGNNIVNLSLLHPRLFDAVVLIDPVMQHSFDENVVASARLSVRRRVQWPSREAAVASFANSKFYKSWDRRVFDRWISYGIRETSPAATGLGRPVMLSTSRDQEVLSFVCPKRDAIKHAFSLSETKDELLDLTKLFDRDEIVNTYHRLPELLPPALFIHAGKSIVSPKNVCRGRIEITGTHVKGSGGAAKGRVKEIVMEEASHLIPMEHVRATAAAIASWLPGELGGSIKREKIAQQELRSIQTGNRDRLGPDLEHLLHYGKLPTKEIRGHL